MLAKGRNIYMSAKKSAIQSQSQPFLQLSAKGIPENNIWKRRGNFFSVRGNVFRCDPADHLKESILGILLLFFLWQGVSGVLYSSIGGSKHAEYESVCHFDVILKLFEFWLKNKLLKLFI